MTNKTIMIGLVAIAFVAGSITTGTMASAQQGGAGGSSIADALNSITAAITGIPDPTVTVNVDPTPVDIVVNAPQGEQGVQGEQGIQGIQGEQGPTGSTPELSVYTVLNQDSISSGTSGIVFVECDEGDLATGGGFSASAQPADYIILASTSNSPSNYLVHVDNFGQNQIVTAKVKCLDLPPLR